MFCEQQAGWHFINMEFSEILTLLALFNAIGTPMKIKGKDVCLTQPPWYIKGCVEYNNSRQTV